ncbi:MAG: hypothetical protein QG620_274 [Patescibacteria group bacterium]|nr:hypothetical protein [Patescibacteria group bacterium]
MDIQKPKTKKITQIFLPIFILAAVSTLAYSIPSACSQTAELNKPAGQQSTLSTIVNYSDDLKNIFQEKNSGAICEIGSADAKVAGVSAGVSTENENSANTGLQSSTVGIDSNATATEEETLPEKVSAPVEKAPAAESKSDSKNITLEKPKPEPKAAVVSKPKSSPTSIGKPGRILANTKTANGKKVCARKNDRPRKSEKNPPGQIDAECCLDPDEIPNSNCHYPAEKYGELIQRYLAGTKK